MNETAFLAIHNQVSVNTAVSFNLNITPIEGTNQGKITSFTATVSSLVDNENDNIVDILLEIEQAELVIAEQTVILNINSRSVHNGVGQRFVYYLVDEVVINLPADINDEPDQGLLDVILTPIVNENKFSNSDYNPFISNAIDNRTSLDLLSSARNESTVQPQNIDSLISTSASKAQVTDSLYYDSGWSNARYKGTSTSANDFGGIEPALTGKSFEGEIYKDTVSDLRVFSGSETTGRIIQNLLHTGDDTLPGFEEKNFPFQIGSTGITDVSQSIFNFKLSSLYRSNFDSGSLEVGSIIRVNSEKMRIEKLLPNNFLQVERGYLDTTPTSHSTNTGITGSDFIRIFDFDGDSSRVTVVDNSKIFLIESEDIIKTDKFGTVYDQITLS